LVFLARVCHTGLKKAYRPNQKANSNEGSNLDAQNEKSIFANDKKEQQLADGNSGARTGGHEREKGLSLIVSANKATDPNAKPKDDVPTSFNRIIRHASKVIGRRKKMWVPKGSTPFKDELITRTSTARPTLKLEPHMTSKVLLSKHTNKKADPWRADWTWSSRRQPQGHMIPSDIRIIGDHIINSYHSMCQCMDKGISIQVCLLVFHGFGIVLGCTMMSLYILLRLFQSYIHVIGLHGRIEVDYCLEAKNK
jgi:hypothetical protein